MSSGANVVAMGGDDAGKVGKTRARVKRPKGWYAKDARIARSLAWAQIKAARDREAERVAGVLARDSLDRRSERLREAALVEVKSGRIKNIEDTFIRPTAEHANHVKFEDVIVEKDGAGREVKALRRVSVNRVKQLYDRGVFTDDTYPAVLWYQRQWEASDFTLGASAASWGETIVGERSYGLMPKSGIAAEARELFRMARGGRRLESAEGEVSYESWSLPPDMLPTFDLVVLHEMSIKKAAAEGKCRYSNAAVAVKHVALLLSGRISHLLPVRAVGAPGSEVSAISAQELDRLRRIEALAEATTVPGEKAAADAAAARIREKLDPIFIDDDGFMRPWDQIAAITRGRVAGYADDEILAGLGEDA